MTHNAEKDATCCACTKAGVAFVHDGPHRKPVCDQHEHMYRQRGYRVDHATRATPSAESSA